MGIHFPPLSSEQQTKVNAAVRRSACVREEGIHSPHQTQLDDTILKTRYHHSNDNEKVKPDETVVRNFEAVLKLLNAAGPSRGSTNTTFNTDEEDGGNDHRVGIHSTHQTQLDSEVISKRYQVPDESVVRNFRAVLRELEGLELSSDTRDDDDNDDGEEEEERQRILEDVAILKQYAHFHLHPEEHVVTTDGMACERNYFSRPSAPEQETFQEAEDRHEVLLDAALLEDSVQKTRYHKSLEHDYFHNKSEMMDRSEEPEIVNERYQNPDEAVVRNFRAVLRELEDLELLSDVRDDDDNDDGEEDRQHILEDVAMLKQYAHFHLHPEEHVVTTDGMACERNYFSRPSAPEQETFQEAEDRHEVLLDAALLEDSVQKTRYHKSLEHDYFHSKSEMMDRSEEPTSPVCVKHTISL